MLKITIRERTLVSPFNEPARDPRVPRDILAPHRKPEREAGSFAETPEFKGEAPVYRDDLFFDRGLLEPFLRRLTRPVGRVVVPSVRTIKRLLSMPSPCKIEFGGRAMFT
jgi:hypothetical protein